MGGYSPLVIYTLGTLCNLFSTINSEDPREEIIYDLNRSEQRHPYFFPPQLFYPGGEFNEPAAAPPFSFELFRPHQYPWLGGGAGGGGGNRRPSHSHHQPHPSEFYPSSPPLQKPFPQLPSSDQPPANFDQSLPICIAGGGISGLNLANLLERKGHKVHVFEKKSTLGGKMETFRQADDVLVEMGAFFIHQSDKSLINLMNHHNLTLKQYPVATNTNFDSHNPTKHAVIPEPTAEQRIKIADAVQKYIVYRSQYEKELEFPYVNASPDLFVSMSIWLERRNLEMLKPLFLTYVVSGYGALEDVSALYTLKFVNSELIASFSNSSRLDNVMVLEEGLDVLVRGMASSLANVFVSSEVVNVFRGRDYVTIFIRGPGDEIKTRKCRSVILAFPPLRTNVERMVIDLSNEEKGVLDLVKIHKYTSAAHYIPTFEDSLYIKCYVCPTSPTKDNNTIPKPPLGSGEAVALLRQSSKKLQNVYSSYSWIRGDYNDVTTEDDLRSIDTQLEEMLKKINGEAKTLHRRSWEYFPHAQNSSLLDNFYEKFQSMQGLRGLYYATTLLSFETMEQALQMTEAFAQRYF